MSVKVKGYEIICKLREMQNTAEGNWILAATLKALIKNATIHADEVYDATQLIDAYEEVMGEFHPTDCDCVDCCEHPSCVKTGICVEHCDECDGECEVSE